MSTPITENSVDFVTCHWCCGHPGWVVDGEREHLGAMYEQMAPCPNCEKGKRIEFGSVGSKQWGPDGYWRGRATRLRKDCRCGEPRKGDHGEARQWMEMLMKKTKSVDPDPAEGGESGSSLTKVLRGDTREASHDCPTFGKVVPWSVEECASCTPATEEVL